MKWFICGDKTYLNLDLGFVYIQANRWSFKERRSWLVTHQVDGSTYCLSLGFWDLIVWIPRPVCAWRSGSRQCPC